MEMILALLIILAGCLVIAYKIQHRRQHKERHAH